MDIFNEMNYFMIDTSSLLYIFHIHLPNVGRSYLSSTIHHVINICKSTDTQWGKSLNGKPVQICRFDICR